MEQDKLTLVERANLDAMRPQWPVIAAVLDRLAPPPKPTCERCGHAEHGDLLCGEFIGAKTWSMNGYCGCCKMPKVDPPQTPGQVFVENTIKNSQDAAFHFGTIDWCKIPFKMTTNGGFPLIRVRECMAKAYDAATAELRAQLKQALETNAALQKGNERLKEQRDQVRADADGKAWRKAYEDVLARYNESMTQTLSAQNELGLIRNTFRKFLDIKP